MLYHLVYKKENEKKRVVLIDRRNGQRKTFSCKGYATVQDILKSYWQVSRWNRVIFSMYTRRNLILQPNPLLLLHCWIVQSQLPCIRVWLFGGNLQYHLNVWIFKEFVVVSVLSDREKLGSHGMTTTAKPQYESIDMSSESERLTQSSQTDDNITLSYSGGLTQSQGKGGLRRPPRSYPAVSSIEHPKPNGIAIKTGS